MKRRSTYFRAAACLLALMQPWVSIPLRAEVIISEIMYDPQNTDTNREWVELFNNGSTAVSLSGWQFGIPSTNSWTSALPATASLNADG